MRRERASSTPPRNSPSIFRARTRELFPTSRIAIRRLAARSVATNFCRPSTPFRRANPNRGRLWCRKQLPHFQECIRQQILPTSEKVFARRDSVGRSSSRLPRAEFAGAPANLARRLSTIAIGSRGAFSLLKEKELLRARRRVRSREESIQSRTNFRYRGCVFPVQFKILVSRRPRVAKTMRRQGIAKAPPVKAWTSNPATPVAALEIRAHRTSAARRGWSPEF